MDYRKFLGGNAQRLVLPYIGGHSVSAPDRRLRVTEPVAVGWWQFEVKGRNATAQEPADPPELDKYRAVRGHLVGDWLFTGGDTAVRLWLMPEEEAPVLAPATGRLWPGGEHLFDTLEFEGEAEEAARAALLDEQQLTGIKGVAPSLRAAFGFSRLQRSAREYQRQVSVREVLAVAYEVADGSKTPESIIEELQERRHRPTTTVTSQRIRQILATHRQRSQDNAHDRAYDVLDAAGAHLLNSRQLGGTRMEVTFRYLDEQFIAVVDWDTLHVYDSGICLEGHDQELGLDSLPSVIHEAIGTGQLYITRR